MLETPDMQTCVRAGDLVSYLYGEATEREAQDFKGHLHICHSCRAELEAFGDVRESISLWREQALSQTASLASELNLAPVQHIKEVPPRRSTFDAIREFFKLSPMWMRGATAFATLLLAALLVIALMNFFERKETPLANQDAPAAPVRQDERANNPAPLIVKEEAPKESAQTDAPRETKRQKNATHKVKATGNVLANNKQNRQPKAPVLSPEERTQLSNLLIAENESEDDVPRLSDLLTETN
jgi:hypothetical protein